MNKQTEALMMAKETLSKWGTANDELACAIVQTVRAIEEALEQPSWQGLSDDEIRNVFDKNSEVIRKETGFFDMIDFARAIEQALKEKNT